MNILYIHTYIAVLMIDVYLRDADCVQVSDLLSADCTTVAVYLSLRRWAVMGNQHAVRDNMYVQ